MRDGVEWKEEISSDRFSGFWCQQLKPAVVGLPNIGQRQSNDSVW